MPLGGHPMTPEVFQTREEAKGSLLDGSLVGAWPPQQKLLPLSMPSSTRQGRQRQDTGQLPFRNME